MRELAPALEATPVGAATMAPLTATSKPHPQRWLLYRALDLQEQAQEIIPKKLWLGPLQVAQNAADLQNLGITTIVSLLEDDAEFDRVQVKKKRLFRVTDLVDTVSATLIDALPYTLDRIAGGEAVLVHCVSGLSLAATLVIALVMEMLGTELIAAYDAVFQKRPVINLCDGFFEILQMRDNACRCKRGESPDPDPAATKQAFNAYRLSAQLRVTLEQAREALTAARGDLEHATSALLKVVEV